MNAYVRAAVVVPFSTLKYISIKLFHFNSFSGSLLSMISPLTEITLDKGGKLTIGKMFKMRDGAKIRVRNGAECNIGDRSSLSSNSIITCLDKIDIGSNVQISPNVFIYDHDHDFRTEGGINARKYKTAPIVIGDNCWIGCNTVILRGTKLGKNCVVGAGCVLKGEYPDGVVIVQKRENIVRMIYEQ